MENIQEKPSLALRFKSFLIECRRIWQVTKKPSKEELLIIVKVTGIGMLLIGFVGFIVHVMWQLVAR